MRLKHELRNGMRPAEEALRVRVGNAKETRQEPERHGLGQVRQHIHPTGGLRSAHHFIYKFGDTRPQRRQMRRIEDTRCQYSPQRSEEHTSELQSLMRISYAVFCLTKKKKHIYRVKQLVIT